MSLPNGRYNARRCASGVETRRDEYVGIDYNPVHPNSVLRRIHLGTSGSHERGDSLRHTQRLVVFRNPSIARGNIPANRAPGIRAMAIDSPPADEAALEPGMLCNRSTHQVDF